MTERARPTPSAPNSTEGAMNPETDRLLSVPEACRKIGVGKTTLYTLVTEKKIAVAKIGNRSLFSEAELDRFIAALLRAAA
jgi:excisionase family DNA binding protein